MKKAQVTIFIIIGILILLSIGIVLYTQQRAVPIKEEFKPVIEEIPVEFQPVRNYVEVCLIRTVTDALDKIGRTGGYNDFSRYNIVSFRDKPTDGDSFRFFSENEDSAIAYWFYFKSNNECQSNCECSSKKPYLRKEQGEPSIETELESYINNNLNVCLDNFNSFKRQGFEINELGDINSRVSVASNDIPVTLNYPISIKIENSETRIENFFIRIPLNLNKIYELAHGIAEAEANRSFSPYLERWTMEIIDSAGLGIRQDRIPPTSASVLDPSRDFVTWLKSDVKASIKNDILTQYTPLFQVYDSLNYQERDDIYAKTTLPIYSGSGLSYNDLAVNFEYLNWWDIYFDITGRGVRGQVISPETVASGMFSFISPQRYNYYYDISYPVKVDIFDPDALNKRGYHFYFGLESNIRDNEPLNCSGVKEDIVAPTAGSLLCDQLQRCANITIETLDAKDNSVLENVMLSYGSYEQCNLGMSRIVSGKAVLSASLPQCIGTCSLIGSKNDYFTESVIKSVRCDNANCEEDDVLCNNENMQVLLESYRIKNISVKKKRMLKQANGWVFNQENVALLDNEFASLTLEKIKDDPGEEDFIAYAIYNSSSDSVLNPGIVPGRYIVSIDLSYELPNTNRDKIIFDEKEVCGGGVLGIGEDCETIGPFEINSTFIEGGAVFNWTLTKDNLDNFDAIEFYVISTLDSSSFNILDMDDIEQLNKAEELSSQYRASIEPSYR